MKNIILKLILFKLVYSCYNLFEIVVVVIVFFYFYFYDQYHQRIAIAITKI